MPHSINQLRASQYLGVLSRRQNNATRQAQLKQPRGYRNIACTNGQLVKVSSVDYIALVERSWRVNDKGYAVSDQSVRRMHRQIMGFVLGRPLSHSEQVDHINHDRLDNRRSNLRIATNQQNGFNRKPRRGTSKYKGVHWSSQKMRWAACVSVENQKIHCGFFTDEVEAAYRYDQFALELFGEYAYLNVLGTTSEPRCTPQ